jgi:hypothetical protein
MKGLAVNQTNQGQTLLATVPSKAMEDERDSLLLVSKKPHSLIDYSYYLRAGALLSTTTGRHLIDRQQKLS